MRMILSIEKFGVEHRTSGIECRKTISIAPDSLVLRLIVLSYVSVMGSCSQSGVVVNSGLGITFRRNRELSLFYGRCILILTGLSDGVLFSHAFVDLNLQRVLGAHVWRLRRVELIMIVVLEEILNCLTLPCSGLSEWLS